jgi:hypothetical protein
VTAARPNPSEIRSLTRVQVELERTLTKWLRRWPPGTSCSECDATNPIALGGVKAKPACYACKVRRSFENHSLIGDHRPPFIITEANAHKIQDETQRILEAALLPGVRLRFAVGLSAWVATTLTDLGTLQPAAR